VTSFRLPPHSVPTPVTASWLTWLRRLVCSCTLMLLYLVLPCARFVCCYAILFPYHLDCHVWLESSLKVPNARQSRDDHDLLLIPSFGVCSLSWPLPSESVSVSPSSRCLFLPLFDSGVFSVFPFLGTCSRLHGVYYRLSFPLRVSVSVPLSLSFSFGA
jgi:hypothetical protein